MQVEFGLANFCPEWSESIVCIGTFDGVHLGHQRVISTAVRVATEEGLPACLVTFDRHPAATLRPSMCPAGIVQLTRRLEKFAKLGVGMCIVLPFDQELSQLDASDFLQKILVNRLKARKLVVGHDFAMGKGRVGDSEWLRGRIPTEIIPPFEVHGRRVSSSLVRKAIHSGDLEEATLLLGEPFEIVGVVVHGDQIGRTLGYPTANLARAFVQILPPDGVFSGTLTLNGKPYSAAVSIGTRPSVKGVDRRIEAFCLDYEGPEFYGETCALQLHKMLRGQIDFADLEDLKQQIGKDVVEIRLLAQSNSLTTSLKQ